MVYSLSRACLTAMAMFVKYVSHMPATMWFSSYVYTSIQSVLQWRVCQNPDFGHLLPLNFRPSEMQLSTTHSSLIDWVHLSPLRDRLIQHFNRSPKLDQVFFDLMENTVVGVSDISAILTGVQAGPGYLGVMNLFNALSSMRSNTVMETTCTQEGFELRDASFFNLFEMYKLPTPDMTRICQIDCSEEGEWVPVSLGKLLASPQLVQKLYHHLKLQSSHESWRIDSVFYEKYPELKWDGYESTVAHGRSYRVDSSWLVATQTVTLDPDQYMQPSALSAPVSV